MPVWGELSRQGAIFWNGRCLLRRLTESLCPPFDPLYFDCCAEFPVIDDRFCRG